ncbi:hypothetical protein DITRI_Ditri12bG0030500 [Diplodiscus trichospermus]
MKQFICFISVMKVVELHQLQSFQQWKMWILRSIKTPGCELEESGNNNVGFLVEMKGSRLEHPPQQSSSVIAFCNFDEEMKRLGVWESDEGASSTIDAPRDNLGSLYCLPYRLMFHRSFEKAKSAAASEDRWLLVNLRSTKEFSSHMLNRDTWGNEAVSQTIGTNFLFWQVYEDSSEGRKVCTYYRLGSIPVVLVFDPITGQKMHSWCGMVQPESLLEDLIQFMEGGPRDYHATLSHKHPRESSVTPQQNIKVSTDETKEDEEMLRAVAASMENSLRVTGTSYEGLDSVFLMGVGSREIFSVLIQYSYFDHSAILNLVKQNQSHFA